MQQRVSPLEFSLQANREKHEELTAKVNEFVDSMKVRMDSRDAEALSMERRFEELAAQMKTLEKQPLRQSLQPLRLYLQPLRLNLQSLRLSLHNPQISQQAKSKPVANPLFENGVQMNP